MRYAVKAQAFSRSSGVEAGASRVEEIDTTQNEMFLFAESILDVKTIYESFWNLMNPDSQEVVFVQSITILEEIEGKVLDRQDVIILDHNWTDSDLFLEIVHAKDSNVVRMADRRKK
jgi:hypothetical protein